MQYKMESIGVFLPIDCPRPVDGRSLRYGGIQKELVGLVLKVDALKESLSKQRPLTPSEKQRLHESFMVDASMIVIESSGTLS